MRVAAIILESSTGIAHTIIVKIADTAKQRKQGLQYLCEDIVLESGLFFIFPNSGQYIFHMRNVRADLDIAFIDEEGWVVEVQRMYHNKNEKYSSIKSYRYALEVSGGRLHQLGVNNGLWRVVSELD